MQYATTVKALIDAGTCADVETGDACGDDATGYYETFEYNGQRVIIVSGAPNHDAESTLFDSDGFFNPNTRCKMHTKIIKFFSNCTYSYLSRS